MGILDESEKRLDELTDCIYWTGNQRDGSVILIEPSLCLSENIFKMKELQNILTIRAIT